MLRPDSKNVIHFVSRPGMLTLTLIFDIATSKDAPREILSNQSLMSDTQESGFAALRTTRRLGKAEGNANGLFRRY